MEVNPELVMEIQAQQVAGLMQENAMLRAGVIQLEGVVEELMKDVKLDEEEGEGTEPEPGEITDLAAVRDKIEAEMQNEEDDPDGS